MNNLQKTVNEFVTQYYLSTSAEMRYIDLVTEVGELGKELLKGSNYGTEPFRPGENTVSELGDVFFSLICIANTLEIDMEGALRASIEKYRKRFSETGTIGSNI